MEKEDSSKTEIKTIKTHCYNCNHDTNQDVLFHTSEIGPREIILRNDKGDDIKSVWEVVGNIWHLTKCRGCDKINFKHILRSAPPVEKTDQVFYFPKRAIRPVPNWVINIPIKYVDILREVYIAVNEQIFTLALTGIRTLLDIYIVEKIGDSGNFKQKIKKLVENNIITSSKAQVLETTIDAGNASAHRGYKPDQETLFQVLSIVENLLESEIVDRAVNQIKQKTPQRGA
ncbi:hypothetical protein D3C87_704330 [compost metagenome]